MRSGIVVYVGIFLVSCFIGYFLPIYYLVVVGVFFVGCFIGMCFVFHYDEKDIEREVEENRKIRETFEDAKIEVIK